MCNIAGYVGTKQAAPILIEMMRAQEGLNAGFYTGIATLHEGKIHYRKLVGNLDDLLSKTDAASLPGNIGIIHSRTPGEGSYEKDEWAHPFVSLKDGDVKYAMVLNGNSGFFRPRIAEREAIAQRLLAHGASFLTRSKTEERHAYGVQLGDGTCAHYSDIFCQLVRYNIEKGNFPADAAAKAFCEYPCEAVVLALTLEKQNAITFARMNFPMHVAFAEHGAYLATAPMAMPEDAGAYHLLPVLSSGYIYKDSFEVKAFPEKPAVVAELTPTLRHRIYDTVLAKLREGEQTVALLAEAIRPLFEDCDCAQVGAAIYEILYDLQKQGILKKELRYIKGQLEGLQAPLFYMSV